MPTTENQLAPLLLRRAEGDATPEQSKVGGTAYLLPGSIPIPLDRNGNAMKLLLQINFDELKMVLRGLLNVFVAEDFDKAAPKDRKSYHIIWQPAFDKGIAPHTVPHDDKEIPLCPLKEPTTEATADSTTVCELFSASHPKLQEAQLICAFASNGVSYSPARAKDDCYSHLVANASAYRIFMSLLIEPSKEYLMMIHADDLRSRQLEKAWLIRI